MKININMLIEERLVNCRSSYSMMTYVMTIYKVEEKKFTFTIPTENKPTILWE